MRNWKSDIKAESQEQIQFNSFRLQFGAYRYAKKSRNTIRGNGVVQQKKKRKAGLKFNPGLALSAFELLGPA